MKICKYPCEKCKIKSYFAKVFDVHWLDNKDCPYKCVYFNKEECEHNGK